MLPSIDSLDAIAIVVYWMLALLCVASLVAQSIWRLKQAGALLLDLRSARSDPCKRQWLATAFGGLWGGLFGAILIAGGVAFAVQGLSGWMGSSDTFFIPFSLMAGLWILLYGLYLGIRLYSVWRLGFGPKIVAGGIWDYEGGLWYGEGRDRA